MRILFFGSTRGTDCSLHYFSAFARLGHSVLPFDPEYFRTETTAEKLWVRLRKGPTPRKVRSVSEALIQVCRTNAFDLVFVMAENFLDGGTLEEIRRTALSTPVFAYHSHDNVFADGICKPRDFSKTLASYDLLFTTKSQNIPRYREVGSANAIFLPSAYEPMVHRPMGASKTDFPVSFVGTYDGSRVPALEKVGWDSLWVWGNGWKRYPGFGQHRQRITARAVYYFEYADVLSRSALSLGLLREEAGDRHTQRTFEIPACGTLQIAPRNEEILSFFKEDEEIVCFGSLDELHDKTRFYLTHESARRRIARKGWERCTHDRHTYQDRVEQVLALVEQKRRPMVYTGALG